MILGLSEIGDESRVQLHQLLDEAIGDALERQSFCGEANGRLRPKALTVGTTEMGVEGITADVKLRLLITPRKYGKVMRHQ